MVSTVTVSRTGSIGAAARTAATLTVLVSVVVMQVEVAADGSTAVARGFLLGGSASFGGLNFCFWF